MYHHRVKTTALHNACLWGDLAQAQALLIKHVNHWMLEYSDYNGDLPLDRAAARGHDEIVALLVYYHKVSGRKYSIHNSQGYHPLLAAAKWWLKVSDAPTSENLRVGKFNLLNASTAYPKILKCLLNNYLRITDVPIHATDYTHNTNALYYLIVLMLTPGFKTASALPIARALLEQGLSLDVRSISQTTARELMANTVIAGLFESKAIEHPSMLPVISPLSERRSLKNHQELIDSKLANRNILGFESPKFKAMLVDKNSNLFIKETIIEPMIPLEPLTPLVIKLKKSFVLDSVLLTKALKYEYQQEWLKIVNKEAVIEVLVKLFQNKSFSKTEKDRILDEIKVNLDLTYEPQGIFCWKSIVPQLFLDMEQLKVSLSIEDHTGSFNRQP